jgi:ketosteroid isomerase-like protein
MSADRKTTVEKINNAFADNNLEKVLSFCTDDLVWTMVGDTTVKGKDAIRKWIASMNPQPPQLMIQQTVAEGDVVITRGDMIMKDSKNGIAHTYSFCDVYRFEGDQVAELIAFVIRTDKARAHEETRKEAGRAV